MTDAISRRNLAIAREAISYARDLKPAMRIVCGVLLKHLNVKTGRCDPGIERIAALSGIHRSSVMRALDELEKKGLIKRHIHEGHAATNSYTFKWDRFCTIAAEFEKRFNGARR